MHDFGKDIWSNFIKAVKEYNMVEKGDRIAIGVSGGKDSLLLVNLFKELKKDRSFSFDYVPITLDLGYTKENLDRLKEYLKEVDIDCNFYDTNIWKVVFDDREEKNPCSLCSSMRRGVLYKKAEELNCNKLALGHHSDDIIETVLINMFYAGSLKTMIPKIKSEKGNFDLIRPMCFIKEDDITKYTTKKEIPVMKCGCKMYEMKHDSKRLEIKILLKNLEKKNPNIKKSIFNSLKNIDLKYVMGYKGLDKE